MSVIAFCWGGSSQKQAKKVHGCLILDGAAEDGKEQSQDSVGVRGWQRGSDKKSQSAPLE